MRNKKFSYASKLVSDDQKSGENIGQMIDENKKVTQNIHLEILEDLKSQEEWFQLKLSERLQAYSNSKSENEVN